MMFIIGTNEREHSAKCLYIGNAFLPFFHSYFCNKNIIVIALRLLDAFLIYYLYRSSHSAHRHCKCCLDPFEFIGGRARTNRIIATALDWLFSFTPMSSMLNQKLNNSIIREIRLFWKEQNLFIICALFGSNCFEFCGISCILDRNSRMRYLPSPYEEWNVAQRHETNCKWSISQSNWERSFWYSFSHVINFHIYFFFLSSFRWKLQKPIISQQQTKIIIKYKIYNIFLIVLFSKDSSFIVTNFQIVHIYAVCSFTFSLQRLPWWTDWNDDFRGIAERGAFHDYLLKEIQLSVWQKRTLISPSSI